ncbi:MAG: PEGA domain-containing protein, partial [Myxococcota bacterium]
MGLPVESSAAPKTKVQIRSKPAGASVWIDDRSGEPAGKTPLTVSLAPGKYTLYFVLPGYETQIKDIVVKRRKRQRESVTLVEVQTGTIDVLPDDANPAADGADVFIDGEKVGSVPDSFEVSEGTHELEVRRDGYELFKQSVEVGRGDTVELIVELVKPSSDTPTPPPAPSTEPDPPTPGQSEPTRERPKLSPLSLTVSGGLAHRHYRYSPTDT